jgi:hypothetical protein
MPVLFGMVFIFVLLKGVKVECEMMSRSVMFVLSITKIRPLVQNLLGAHIRLQYSLFA